mmetsp:Transcript_43213/g.104288  ORF Transcript_43213/g.104288 Transcript_43213/m.104288 type:complete len:228 (-) Transcript_43213:228-911(-)
MRSMTPSASMGIPTAATAPGLNAMLASGFTSAFFAARNTDSAAAAEPLPLRSAPVTSGPAPPPASGPVPWSTSAPGPRPAASLEKTGSPPTSAGAGLWASSGGAATVSAAAGEGRGTSRGNGKALGCDAEARHSCWYLIRAPSITLSPRATPSSSSFRHMLSRASYSSLTAASRLATRRCSSPIRLVMSSKPCCFVCTSCFNMWTSASSFLASCLSTSADRCSSASV